MKNPEEIKMKNTSNKLKYTVVNKENIDIAYNIQKEVWKENPDYNNFVEKAINTSKDNVSFIVYNEENPIGITGVYVDKKYNDSIWLDWFCILPKYRQKGFGKQVLIDTIEYARALNNFLYFRIETTYWKDRPALILYDKIMPFKEKYTAEDTDTYSYNRLIYTYNYTNKKEMWNNRFLGLNDYYMVDVILADKKDIDELSRLRIFQQKDDYKEEYVDKYDLEKITKEYLIEHLNKDIYFFMVKESNKIIATCGLQILKLLPQCIDKGAEGYICNVYTKDEYRNRGIQTKILKKCIQFAKDYDLSCIRLSTDSEAAIKIYNKLGLEFDTLAMKLKL